MTRSSRILLADILEAARLLDEYTADISLEEFRDNVEKQDSVIRRIIVIGEAVKGLPTALRARYAGTRAWNRPRLELFVPSNRFWTMLSPGSQPPAQVQGGQLARFSAAA